jgi:protein-S-isoprenylcysteine O-methyltransferase Ste14
MNVSIIIWAGWLATELLLTRLLRSKTPASKEQDKNSLLLMWTAIIVSISAGVLVLILVPASISRTRYIIYWGLIIIICGVIIRYSAIRTLGKFFTVNLSVQDNQHLVRKGLYKYIRHPSYAGSLLSFIGLGISFNNWLSVLVIIIPITLTFLYRISIEERLLLQQFGSEYSDYAAGTKRLIPFIY